MNAVAEEIQEETKALSREYEQLRDEMLRSIPGIPKPASMKPNVVVDNYVVQPSNPIPMLDTAFAKAFAVQDPGDQDASLYGLVCSTKMPIRGNVVKALLEVDVPGMVKLHAAGIAEISGIPGRRLVLIYDRPKGRSLAAIMAERPKALPESFVSENFVGPIGHVIHQLRELGISHGKICPSNIYISETVVLGECASEPCGYSTPYLFEPPERAQSLPAGKGESLPEHDMYSLGVLAAYLRLGEKLFERSRTVDEHVMRLLRTGSYQALTANIDFSDAMTDLLRGTLADIHSERWTWTQLKPWLKGRRYNMLAPTVPGNSSRPFMIDKQDFITMREVAHGIFKNWEQTLSFFLDGSIYRWLDLSARRRDISEVLKRAIISLGGLVISRSAHQRDELSARVITILDPQAPLTVREVRAHASGIGTLMLEGFTSGNQAIIQGCVSMIEWGLAVVWADMYRKRDLEPPGDQTDVLWQLDRMRVMMRIPGFGFGFERALYDLNPFLSCQSPLIGETQAVTPKELLIALETVAADKSRQSPPFDTHIAAFIGSRLNIARESYLSEYNNIPKLSRHKAFVALRMLEQAQEACGAPPLPALTTWVATELLAAIEEFHSKTVRSQLQVGIRQLAEKGLLKPISGYINQKFFALSNVDGYRDAIQTYFSMSEEIATLRNKTIQKRRAAISGYAVAKSIAHIGLALVAFILLKEQILR